MKTVAFLVLLALAAPTGAIGQTPPPPTQVAPPPPPLRGPILRPDNRTGPLDEMRLDNTQWPIVGESRERIIFANRLARMANAGDCPGAIRTAAEAGDRVLAQRLFDLCKRPNA